MNMEKMKDSKAIAIVVVILFVTTFPSLFTLVFHIDIRQDKHDREPHEVAVMFENALMQGDGALIKQLATPEYAKRIANTHDISQGSQNNRTLPDHWVMEEYEVDENHYLYHLMWEDETGQTRDYLRVKKVNNEWRAEVVQPDRFKSEVKEIKPRVLLGDKQ